MQDSIGLDYPEFERSTHCEKFHEFFQLQNSRLFALHVSEHSCVPAEPFGGKTTLTCVFQDSF